MTPNEKGRFCNACSKTVIDFTKMNTFEIQDFININKGKSICGHIKQSQLDSINLQIPIQSINKDLRFHKLFLYALLITMGTSLFSCITDNGSIKKIDSIEVVDTTLKTLDSIPKKSCDTNVTKIKDTLKNKSDSISKTHEIIETIELTGLLEGEMIVEETHPYNEELEDPIILGDIVSPEEEESFFNLYSIDSIPEFPNTPKGLSLVEKRDYFQKTLRDFVKTNFDTPEDLGITGKTKTYVRFEINAIGEINIIKTRSVHPRLEEETKRVLHLLPVFKPARNSNKKVSMLYNLPIIVNFDN
jgi:hypothetical protein